MTCSFHDGIRVHVSWGFPGLVDETGCRQEETGPDGPQPFAGRECFKEFVSNLSAMNQSV